METLREPGTVPGSHLWTPVGLPGPSVWTSGLLLGAQATHLVGEVPDPAASYYFQLK